MATQKPRHHGRDHLPGGEDPIPGGVAAWAIAQAGDYIGASYLPVPNNTPTTLPFGRFQTSDPSIFSTLPDGAAGDTSIHASADGIYIAEMTANWSIYFNAPAEIIPVSSTGNGPPTDAFPDTGFNPATAVAGVGTVGAGGVGPPDMFNHTTIVRVVDSSGTLGLAEETVGFEVRALQLSGATRSVTGFVLIVAYIPTPAGVTTVY